MPALRSDHFGRPLLGVQLLQRGGKRPLFDVDEQPQPLSVPLRAECDLLRPGSGPRVHRSRHSSRSPVRQASDGAGVVADVRQNVPPGPAW